MLKIITSDHLFENQTESHYRFHLQIDPVLYPQVHDFYEIVLVTSGVMHMNICGESYSLQKGHLILIRPDDIHTKSGHDCTHINLAFPADAVNALFTYLCDEEHAALLKGLPVVPPVCLNPQDLYDLQKKMQFLNTISVSDWCRTRTVLRIILFEVITHHILSLLVTDPIYPQLPAWFSKALTAWHDTEHRQEGLEFFCSCTGHTKEHICRTFKRCMGMTPTAYFNRQRLNYAVNLLLHSDYSVIEIAFEAGFKSTSRFYQTFRDTYGLSPKQFCTQYK